MDVTRFAPSPTGYLHLGHAFAALTAARAAARAGGRFLLRIEDLDAARARESFVHAIFEDLTWLGLSWEPDVLRQSARRAAYRRALDVLVHAGLVYPCFCTRKDIAQAVCAPHGAADGEGPLYPGTCRMLPPSARAERLARGQAHALRLDAAAAARMAGPLVFVEHDERIPVDPLRAGDIVLARKDRAAAYHLAVVVDDAFQGVTLVTRGEDLLAATHVQRLLQALLGLAVPGYAHHRLILDAQGRKFSKREGARSLRALRAAGMTPAAVRAELGFA